MQLTVRPATTVDATSAAEVPRAVAEERRWVLTEPPVDVEALAGRVRAMIIGEAERLWVVEEEGRIVGSLGLQVAAVAGLRTIGIAILAEARGRGYGRRLLETALEEAPATGAAKVELEVFPWNGPAIALYSSAGFVVEGLRRHHYPCHDGTRWPALLMAWFPEGIGG